MHVRSVSVCLCVSYAELHFKMPVNWKIMDKVDRASRDMDEEVKKNNRQNTRAHIQRERASNVCSQIILLKVILGRIETW